MKKALIVCIVGILFILLLNFAINSMNKRVDVYKEKVKKHAELVKKDLIDLTDEELGNLVGPQEASDVKCEKAFLTDNKDLVLHNCTVKDTDTKYCYYKDTVYKCNNKKYQELYNDVAK